MFPPDDSHRVLPEPCALCRRVRQLGRCAEGLPGGGRAVAACEGSAVAPILRGQYQCVAAYLEIPDLNFASETCQGAISGLTVIRSEVTKATSNRVSITAKGFLNARIDKIHENDQIDCDVDQEIGIRGATHESRSI